VISSNGLLMLPILAALYLSLRSQQARLLLLLAAGAAALGAEVWMAEPAARLKAGLDLLLVIGLLAVCWIGCRLLPRASAHHHHHRWLGALIVLLVLPLLTYKLLLAGAAAWLLPWAYQ
jgi:predicted tellurium resistance membrane protein TerC